jgi:hypothetical protein
MRRSCVLLLASVLSLGSCGQADDPTSVLRFEGSDRLLVSERTRPRDGWEMTSGSLFIRDGHGWTGKPNRGEPRGGPHGVTNSAVFRLRSETDGYRDADIEVRFRVLGFTDSGPRRDYDGVHLWLRYGDPGDLYALSVNRRDGSTLIKRKTAAEGYSTLATGRPVRPDDSWHTARASARDVHGGVRLRLWLDDQLVAEATDPDPLPPGRAGVRADGCELELDDLAIEPH